MSLRNIAHNAVKSAVQQKRIQPARLLACVDCGGGAQHYDHRDYSRPLDVQPGA